MNALIDYRNGKYQGYINSDQHRNGFGILIDDDLSFYASEWKQGKLNGSTIIYITHGKYIYGQWTDNQPHGLNVFRIGDTVVLGQFDNGSIVKKVIIIFEKFNFLCILQQNKGQWAVCQRKLLKNYSQLTKNIQQAGIPMQPQYYTLIQYTISMQNQNVSTQQCQGSDNSYFGYKQGLGIIFNSNNTVVSIGYHANKKLVEFGGKYEGSQYVIQGNFNTNEIIRYTNQRPKTQIYSIYQKLHKRSLNFKNQYFDSKIKLLSKIEQLIRSKINQIVKQYYNNNNANQHLFTAIDLNDSLDYHIQILQDKNKNNNKYCTYQFKYQNQKINQKINNYQYQQLSPKLKQQINNNQSNNHHPPNKKSLKNSTLINHPPPSPVLIKKSSNKQKQKYQKQIQLTRTPSKKHIQYPNQQQQQQFIYDNACQTTFLNTQIKSPNHSKHQKSATQLKITKNSIIKNKGYDQGEQNIIYKNYYHKQHNQSPINQMAIQSKNYQIQKQINNNNNNNINNNTNNNNNNKTYLPSFKYNNEQLEKEQKYSQKYSQKLKSSIYYQQNNKNQMIKQNKYQLIKQNKYQLIKQNKIYKQYHHIDKININQSSQQLYQKKYGLNKSKKSIISSTRTEDICKTPIKKPNYQNLSQRRKRLLKSFKNLKNQLQSIPSTVTSTIQSQSPNQVPPTKLSFICLPSQNNPPEIINSPSLQPLQQSDPIPDKKQKGSSYSSKNLQQNQMLMPLAICKNNSQGNNFKKSNFIHKNIHKTHENKQQKAIPCQRDNILKQANDFPIQPSSKQNIQSIPPTYIYPSISTKHPLQQKLLKTQIPLKIQKIQKIQTIQNHKLQTDLLTPNKKKIYKYYFEQ